MLIFQLTDCDLKREDNLNASDSFYSILALANSNAATSEPDTFHTVGGSITGSLNGGTITLQLNSANNISKNSLGTFTFDTTLKTNTSYTVTVLTKPNGVSCGITSGGSGNVSRANITNVIVDCNECGNNFKASYEACDDGNTSNGDGCSNVCTIESGYTCNTFANVSICSN